MGRTHNHDGQLIVFEGIDGAGTTTQAQRYAEHLTSMRRLVYVTREPSDGPIGSLLRLGLAGRVRLGASNQAQAMALLFAADRLDHLAHEVEPYLRDGYIVVCDRYDLSSITYQTATARPETNRDGEFAEWVRSLNRFALRPDVTVILEVSPAQAKRRRSERLGAPELFERDELQAKLAGLYQQAEKLLPADKLLRVDGDQSIDEVAQAVREALANIVDG